MREKLLASGRVQYFPLHDYKGNKIFASLLGEDVYRVDVKKCVVDGTFFNTSVPSMHERKFAVDDGVKCVPPNALPGLASKYKAYTILGGGKTAMDAAVWLLDHGALPEELTWVCPRASWLINRAGTQPGKAFFKQTVGGIAKQFEAMQSASSTEDLFLRLEEAGQMLRIDRDVTPTMFHYATISDGEVEQLARIEHVIHGERVVRLTGSGMALESGRHIEAATDTLYVDCTATAVVFTGDNKTKPVFEDGLITLQAVFAPLVTYSAAIIARIEGQFEDNTQKNALATPVELADTPYEWMASTAQNMMNQNMWSETPEMRDWINTCRLNPAAAAIREASMSDPENAAIMKRVQAAAVPAVMNMYKLMSEGQSDA